MPNKQCESNPMKNIWDQKKRRRALLAALPIKEKIQIIIKMQKMLYPILRTHHPDHLKPWNMSK